VRAIRVAGEDIPRPPPEGRRFYPIFRGGYHDDPADQISPRFTDVYEVAIPMRYQQTRVSPPEERRRRPNGIRDITAQMGIRLAWDSSEQRWTPYQMVGYNSGGSAGVVPPVF